MFTEVSSIQRCPYRGAPLYIYLFKGYDNNDNTSIRATIYKSVDRV